MKTLEWVKVVFQNADGSGETFQVVPNLTSTFEAELNRTDPVVIVNITGFPDADRKRLIQCKLPSKILSIGCKVELCSTQDELRERLPHAED